MASSKLSSSEHDVLRLIIRNSGISRNELAQTTGLSMTTIAHTLKKLKELRYITHTRSNIASQGGRPSDSYSFAYSRCICIGVMVRSNVIHLIATNLRGDVVHHNSFNLTDFHTASFYDGLALAIEKFICTSHIDTRHIRGIGVTVASQAATDDSSETLLQSAIESHVPYPVRIMREPLALAAAETLYMPEISHAVCLYLNTTMSSAFIEDYRYVKNASFVEHMTLYPYMPSSSTHLSPLDSPSPLVCDCGQHGCANLYCSAQALLHSTAHPAQSVQNFMNTIRDGDYAANRVFDTYKNSLALLIHNIRMVHRIPVIIGGEVAKYMDSADIVELRSRTRTLAPQTLIPELVAGTTPSVIKSVCHSNQAIIGAAYVLAQDYLDSLLS
ncbi:ROK family transcriptional regulator [Alloscardovia venturai]|uniref:ROK family transcriptional regulator n=1 Tax=Alloscardovia venturai TaxID=1769421 RepID=A0ABW2Y8A3_9BIFI